MIPADAETTIQQIIIAISSGDYPGAVAGAKSSRCSAADLERTASEYGGNFLAPPFSEWDVVALNPETGHKGWSVVAPLWSGNEGGRSDLEVRFTVIMESGESRVELDDMLVG